VDVVRGVLRVEGSKGTRGQIRPRVVPLTRHLRQALATHCAGRVGLLWPYWDGTPETLDATTRRLSARFAVLFEYAKVVDFTDKYYNTPSRIVLKKTVKYTDPASIKGKKIGVLKGSTQEAYAMGELKPAGVVVNSYEAQDQVYLDIKSGRLDGTVADFMEVTGGFLSKPEGEKYALAGPDLKEPKYFGYGAGVALRKGEDALKAELNAAIKAIRSNGSYKTLNDKYFAKFNIDVYGE
jgi:membrane-bound lytic murein transglycosylase MltF